MSQFISNADVVMYNDLVHLQFYDQGNRLRGTARTKSNVIGASEIFPVYGAGVATLHVPRTDVTTMNPSVVQVTCTLEDWDAADYTDRFEQAKVNFDEAQTIAKISVQAIGRQFDQTQIDATAVSGTTNVVAANAENLTYAKILEAIAFLDNNGVPYDNRYCMITTSGQTSLLQDERFISNRYTNNMLVEKGSINGVSVLGVKFIVIPDSVINGLTFGLPTAGDIRTAFMWHEDSMGVCIGAGLDQTTYMDWVPEKFSMLVRTVMSVGSVAIDARGIVDIDYDQTA